MLKISDPLIELLAIKLFEHDSQCGKWPPNSEYQYNNWMQLHDDDRELYRKIARGE